MTNEKAGYNKIQNKFGIYFSVMTTIILTISIFTFYINTANNMRQNIRKRIENIVSIASFQIDADAHANLNDFKDENSETYLDIQKSLRQIRNATSDIYYIYTMRYDKDNGITFIVDCEENPEEIAHLGDIYHEASQFLKDNFETMTSPTVEKDFYTDNWGTWLTGYAPFYNSNGEIEGILGIDIQADTVKNYELKLFWIALIILAIIIPIVFILGRIIGKKIAIPIVNLTKASIKVAAGDLDHFVIVETDDEIGLLAKAFNKMIKQMKELITCLEQKVKERTQNLEKEIRNHKLTEMALRKSEEKYRELFEKSDDASLIINNGKFIDCNQATIKMLRYKSKKECLYTHPSKLSPEYQPDGRRSIDKANEMIKIALENGSHRFEWYHRKSDGEIFPVEVLLTTISYDKDNYIIHTVWRDITKRKQREKEIESGREQLQILNKIIRHDLSNDFLVIQSAIKLFKKTSDMNMIEQAENRIIKSLSSISRYNKQEFLINSNTKLKEISIVDLLDKLISEFPKIKFFIEGNCNVYADDTLYSVFKNLIQNSINHGASTQIKIKLTSESDNCNIVFTDNGSGIPNSIKDKIFDEGFHFGEKGNTGIGLHIVSKTIERFGGTICFEDNLSIGATFVISLKKSKAL